MDTMMTQIFYEVMYLHGTCMCEGLINSASGNEWMCTESTDQTNIIYYSVENSLYKAHSSHD